MPGRMRRTLLLTGSIACAFAIISGVAGAAGLASPTGLHILLATAPPSILDVDLGSVSPVTGLGAPRKGGLWVMPSMGEGAAGTLLEGSRAQAFVVRANGTAQRGVRGASVLPANSTRGTWVLDHAAHGRCTLRLVPSRRARVPAPCGFLQADDGAGVLIDTAHATVLVDHRTGRTLVQLEAPEGSVAPLHGHLAFEQRAYSSLALVDLRSGHRQALRWPSPLDELDAVVPEPNGPLVAVGFATVGTNPQAEDLFILDTRSARFTHIPGYPIREDLKHSSTAWTRDGRLVVITGLGGKTTLGVYRPGAHSVALRAIDPPPYAGSDTFVPISGQG